MIAVGETLARIGRYQRAERSVHYARGRGVDALHVSVALDIVAPVPGRTWTAICCGCLDRVEHDLADDLVHRISMHTWQSAGPCMLCSYSGCDTLVAALKRSAS